jgi:hypothetical protein
LHITTIKLYYLGMIKWLQSLSKTKKFAFLISTITLSFPLGAAFGFFIGLVSITFIPTCCNNNGCQSCFEFNGLIGYEASGLFGLWFGMILIPTVYIGFIIYIYLKATHDKNQEKMGHLNR